MKGSMPVGARARQPDAIIVALALSLEMAVAARTVGGQARWRHTRANKERND